VGLALGLWLYSGYEQCSTVAEEVENPRRTYPIALALVVPMSIAAYFLPTLASLAALGNWGDWHTGYFSTAAQLIGGPWLGAWLTVAAMVTYVSLLNATILASTRMPFAMAEDGYLPNALSGVHPRYGTPWIAIIASAVVYALLAIHSLVQLIAVYAWLRVATTVMTVLAAWQLRRKEPGMARPFVIPGGKSGLRYAVIAVIIMSVVALVGSDRFGLIWGPVALAVGPAVYWALQRVHKPAEPPHTA
jgi:amino acid transporter